MSQHGGPQPNRSERSQTTQADGTGQSHSGSRLPLPSGTITFLFTDIEGSTKLWERCPEAMRRALARHDQLLREVIEEHNGYIFKTVGDAFCAAFSTAPDAVNAALQAHLALLKQEWAETGALCVRMGLHSGVAEERDNDYFGPTLNRVARLQSVGYGQQTLLSQATYELVRSALPTEAGLIDLGLQRLKDLAAPEHVWQLTHPSLPQEFPPLKSLDYLPTNLPVQMTSFIGREQQIDAIQRELQKTRLLTLTGSGGCGKTRLALQAAAAALDEYAEGVWLVELAPLTDPALIPQTVVEALNIREVPGEPITKTLISFLKDKRMLLVLDNCEHLLEASARLVDAILRACPKVRVLASSREALGIGGECAYRVPSLSVPDLKEAHTPQNLSEYESVRLFIERAMSVKTDFVVTPQNATALASVCHHLDGIPLAIELAAARVRVLPVEEINTRLDHRFRLLTGGSRTALPRQQTLRALIDWSYDLLNEQEQALLCRLSVFAGGWRLEAAAQVCAGDGIEDWETLDLLTSLVDKSLVVYEEREGQARYRLLETVRQYARDRLVEGGESEAVRERQRDCFLALAEEVEPKLTGPEQAEWFERLDEEGENLRVALDWSLLEAGSEEGLRLCGALWKFWWMRGHLSEGRTWCVRALDTAGGEERSPERAKALNGVGNLASSQGNYASARTYHEESLAIKREFGDRSGIAYSLNNLGIVALNQGDFPSARAYFEESLAIKREFGDRDGIANSLNNLGIMALNQGDYLSARAYFEESLAIQKEIGDRSCIAISLNNLGAVALDQGDYATARAYFEESLAIQKEIGDRNGIAMSLNNLGSMALDQGDYVSARTYHEESLAIKREFGDRSGVAYSLNNLGTVALDQGDYATARAYFEESLAIRKEIGDRSGIANSLNNLGSVAVDQGDYATARAYFEESLAIRKEIGDRNGIATSLNNLGIVTLDQGDYATTRAYFEESMVSRREIGDRDGIVDSLEAFSRLAIKESKSEQAAVLSGAEEILREKVGSLLPPNQRERHDREVAEVRQALGNEVFSSAWAKGRAMPLEQAIVLALEGSDV